ncbi:MAG: Arc family DNA-binding protein [Clostridia bacterium]|nr:Arc family DNA-binding protein [Clostridia bacterium]MBQ3462604.1 Arc family DNA-binding protein [Clostridia bacterium]MBQ6559118.1 Arc family DNA-binding protein [Clostridia bacterium]
MNKEIKSVSIRIPEPLLKELHYVADYEGRSANSQVLYLIRQCVAEFKEKHGAIEF